MYEVKIYPENDTPLIKSLIDNISKSGNYKDYEGFSKYIEKLKEYGFEINKQYKQGAFKKIADNLYELRPNNIRIFFTFKNNTFYILNGFYKKGRKTPKKEKNKAIKYINEIMNIH